MSTAYNRKKQPELVRRTLLDCAARLAADEGLAGVTIQAVADAAGVTKGGLFHHFPSKEALLEGMCLDLLEKADSEIDALMANDPEPRGAFTRAYVECAFLAEADRASTVGALGLSMIADPSLGTLWSTWRQERLTRHRATDGTLELEIIRLAADGAWLDELVGRASAAESRAAVRERLLAMTRHG